MPRSPLAPISTAEQVRPAAPMSWMAMTARWRHQLEACFEQQHFSVEGVADLNGRALLLDLVVEFGRGHGRAADAVAAGLGAEIDDRQADALASRGRSRCSWRCRRQSALTRMLPL